MENVDHNALKNIFLLIIHVFHVQKNVRIAMDQVPLNV